MAELLNQTIPLEVLLIDPALSDSIKAFEKDAFQWHVESSHKTKSSALFTSNIDNVFSLSRLSHGEDIFAESQKVENLKRLNYLEGKDLSIENLRKKIQKFHDAGLLTVVFIDRIDSLLVRNLSQIGDELVPFVKLANWEEHDSELMNLVDYPQRALMDNDVRITVANEKVFEAFVSSLEQWLVDNMDITEARINEIVGHVSLDSKKIPKSLVSTTSKQQTKPVSPSKVQIVSIGELPEKIAAWVKQLIEKSRVQDPVFGVGIGAAGQGQLDGIKGRIFAAGTNEETEFYGELKRGGKGKPDHFIIKTVSDKPQLMEHLRVFVLISQDLDNPLQLKLQCQDSITDKTNKKALYQVELKLKPGEDIQEFEIFDLRDNV